MRQEILADEIAPAPLAQGIPQAHAEVIGARAEAEATPDPSFGAGSSLGDPCPSGGAPNGGPLAHNATLSRWSAYQVATAYLTREVQVN